MDIFQFLNEKGVRYKQKGDELCLEYCLYCNGGSSGDKETAYFNLTKQTYNCFRGKCGEGKHFNELLKDNGYSLRLSSDFKLPEQLKKPFQKPVTKVKELKESNSIVKYWDKRGISEKTLQKTSVFQGSKDEIVFPYYYEGELVLVKHLMVNRKENGKKIMWCDRGGKFVLWLWDRVDRSKGGLIITEGEGDALTLIECGFPNVVSVPSGTNNLDWINYHYDDLMKFDKIVLLFDNDSAGKKARKEVIARIGIEKICEVKHYDTDINDYYMKYGKQKTQDLIKNNFFIDIPAILEYSQIENLDLSSMNKISTGFEGIDQQIGGLYDGTLTIFTGDSGAGKSTFLSQLSLNLADQNEKVFIFSGELSCQMTKAILDLQSCGDLIEWKDDPIKKSKVSYVPEKINVLLNHYYRGKLYLFDSDNFTADNENLFEYMSSCYQRYGIKNFIIDNMMMIQHKDNISQINKETDITLKCKKFARQHDSRVIFVNHPKKTEGGKIDKNAISGSKNITNLADLVIKLERITDEMLLQEEFEVYRDRDALLTILKNRLFGVTDRYIPFNFYFPNRRFYEDDHQKYRCYGWHNLV